MDPLELLEDRLENPPKLWMPYGEPDDRDAAITDPKVTGIVETVEERVGDYGTYPVIVLVRKDRSRVQVAGFGTVLGRRLRGVRVGDAVGITYRGLRESTTPGRKAYHDYEVVVVRDGAVVSTDGTEAEAEEPDELPMPEDGDG